MLKLALRLALPHSPDNMIYLTDEVNKQESMTVLLQLMGR